VCVYYVSSTVYSNRTFRVFLKVEESVTKFKYRTSLLGIWQKFVGKVKSPNFFAAVVLPDHCYDTITVLVFLRKRPFPPICPLFALNDFFLERRKRFVF